MKKFNNSEEFIITLLPEAIDMVKSSIVPKENINNLFNSLRVEENGNIQVIPNMMDPSKVEPDEGASKENSYVRVKKMEGGNASKTVMKPSVYDQNRDLAGNFLPDTEELGTIRGEAASSFVLVVTAVLALIAIVMTVTLNILNII